MPFQYNRRDPKHVKAMIRERRFDDEFKKAVREAHKWKPKALCELLRSNASLSEEHRLELADLIEWHLQVRSGRGRPRGSILKSPGQEIEEQFIYWARQKLARLRTQSGGKVPRGMLNKIIAEGEGLFCKSHEGQPGLSGVSRINIRNALKRGTRRKF